jgi:hypothetical protein
MRLSLVVLLFCSPAALAESVGFYPLQPPHGDAQLAAQLASQLHEPKGGTVLVTVEPSSCAADEDVCLAAAARRAGLAAITSAAVEEIASGYKLHVRAFAADQKLLGEWQQEVPRAELGAALQRGVCESLGAVCGENPVSVPRAALVDLSVAESRSRAELTLFSGGVGMLVAAAGVGLYAHASQAGPASRTGLSESSSARSANILAIALAATGAGAIVAGGVIVVLTPEAATLQARF